MTDELRSLLLLIPNDRDRARAIELLDAREDRLTAKELQTVCAAMAGNHPASLAQYRMPALRKLARMRRVVRPGSREER